MLDPTEVGLAKEPQLFLLDVAPCLCLPLCIPHKPQLLLHSVPLVGHLECNLYHNLTYPIISFCPARQTEFTDSTARLRLFIHAINKIIYSQLCLSLSAPKALIYMFAIAPVKHCDPFYCENYMLLLLP